MGLFRKKNRLDDLMLSEKDMAAFEKMVTEQIGEYESVFHEIASPDLHIDVIPVPPSEKRDYYTFVTMGMSGYRMSVPSSYGKMNRAELDIRLPKDWDIHSTEEKWYWPIGVLKTLARMPYREQSWLGLYHDADFGDPFTEGSELCAVMLDLFDDDIEPLKLESGDKLVLYNVIPITRAEMEFKLQEDGETLTAKLGNEIIHGPMDPYRKSVV